MDSKQFSVYEETSLWKMPPAALGIAVAEDQCGIPSP